MVDQLGRQFLLIEHLEGQRGAILSDIVLIDRQAKEMAEKFHRIVFVGTGGQRFPQNLFVVFRFEGMRV